ncbi:unnamed protein product [Heterobilharzia americana]|nr:unnamed protein product [Heterobilharzia americana]
MLYLRSPEASPVFLGYSRQKSSLAQSKCSRVSSSTRTVYALLLARHSLLHDPVQSTIIRKMIGDSRWQPCLVLLLSLVFTSKASMNFPL